MQRVVEPEILDTLAVDDPRAVRSRRDLRLVNWFMRGEDWVLAQLQRLKPDKIIELGAGEGRLLNLIQEELPSAEVVGVDLVSRPSEVRDSVKWRQGDVMEYDGFCAETVVVANLFVHHFDQQSLGQLIKRIGSVRAVIFAEPYRGMVPLLMGRCLFPFVNEVTRHDMMVSIRAGFVMGEIPAMFGDEFEWAESRGLFGGIRVIGVLR